MDKHFISEENRHKLVEELSRSARVYYPEEEGEDYHLSVSPAGEVPRVVFNRYRCVQSLKSVLFESRLEVSADLAGESGAAPAGQVVLGVKECDLHGLAVLDHVFLGGSIKDPFYQQNRDRTLIVSSDCTAFKETCFCAIVGGRPFPESGYDLNLSPVGGGYVVDVGSAKGRKIVDGSPGLFSAATEKQLDEVSESRRGVEESLKERQKEWAFCWGGVTRELIERTYESPVWKDEAEHCVECGACNFVCPTCHCFLLSDEGKEEFRRLRNWDSCQYKGFSRVGGGGNPRPELYERLRNRYEKKFIFCPDVIDVCGCTGCGRCVEACIGNIDMRKVLGRLSGCKVVQS